MKLIVVKEKDRPCPHCGMPMQIRVHRHIEKSGLRKQFNFDSWFYCDNPKCRTKVDFDDRYTVSHRDGNKRDRWFSKKSNAGLIEAIDTLRIELPGWWFSISNCHVCADAIIGPDRTGPDRELLRHRQFEEGFGVALRHPATLAEALSRAIDNAKVARAQYK